MRSVRSVRGRISMVERSHVLTETLVEIGHGPGPPPGRNGNAAFVTLSFVQTCESLTHVRFHRVCCMSACGGRRGGRANPKINNVCEFCRACRVQTVHVK